MDPHHLPPPTTAKREGREGFRTSLIRVSRNGKSQVLVLRYPTTQVALSLAWLPETRAWDAPSSTGGPYSTKATRRQLVLYGTTPNPTTHPVTTTSAFVLDPPLSVLGVYGVGGGAPGPIIVGVGGGGVIAVRSVQIPNAGNSDAGASSCKDTVHAIGVACFVR